MPVVSISILTLLPGVVGGSETYTRELLRALGQVGTRDYRVIAPPAAADAGGGLPTVVARRYHGPRLVAMARAAVDPSIARLLADADVVHYPLTVPLPTTRLRSVVTLHDVQHLDLPQLFTRPERVWRALAYDRAARRADRVLVLSEFVKQRVVKRLQISPERLVVTPLGVDHLLFRPRNVDREPFLLYPAKPWPHKNHARLFEAFVRLRSSQPSLRLVLTGGGAYPRVPDGVDVLGNVPRGKVADLMQRAAALVFPSLYEGFGLPPLEAMACGCPVACSAAAALPETVGRAARLFDPYDATAIAGAVLDVLDAPAEWAARGIEHAAGYSWERTARGTDAVYAELEA